VGPSSIYSSGKLPIERTVVKTSFALACVLGCLAGSPSAARAQASPRSQTVLTPHIGVTSESDFVSGSVRFSDGDVDFISIEPRTGLLVGVELGHRFTSGLVGVLGLSYASASARYIEDNRVRPDVDVRSLRIQPGVMVSLMNTSALELAAGGGLSIVRIGLDGLVWDDRRFDTSSLALGLFGAASIDVPLTQRLAFHAHLALEVTRPSFGNLEVALARAEGEAAAYVDRGLRSAALLVVGLAIGL
jgi:hypothetical protein